MKGIAFYLSPSIMLGIIHMSEEECSGSSRTGKICVGISMDGWTLQCGFEGKLVLADRVLPFFRPVTVDIMGGTIVFPSVNSSGSLSSTTTWETGVRFDLIFGAGVIF